MLLPPVACGSTDSIHFRIPPTSTSTQLPTLFHTSPSLLSIPPPSSLFWSTLVYFLIRKSYLLSLDSFLNSFICTFIFLSLRGPAWSPQLPASILVPSQLERLVPALSGFGLLRQSTFILLLIFFLIGALCRLLICSFHIFIPPFCFHCPFLS